MNRVWMRWGAVGAVVSVLAACGGGAIPPDTFYRLPDAQQTASTRTLSGTLEVPPLRAEGALNDRAVLYSDGATVVRKYNYHFWIEPPSGLLQSYFVERLRESRVFERIAQPEMRVPRDYDLIGSLKHFEHITARGSDTVRVEIEFALRKVRGGTTLLLNSYSVEERSSGGNVADAVEAFGRALDQIYRQLQADIESIDLNV